MSMWPEGSFALPMSVYDCPQTEHFNWIRSKLTLESKTEMETPHQWSVYYHVRGRLDTKYAALHFCSKLSDFITSNVRTAAPKWPPGNYCIFKAGDSCPTGNYQQWF